MKKFIAVLTCLILFSAILPLSLSAAGVPIDAANFPDPVFRSYVQQFDFDKDGTLSENECAAVESISIQLTHKAVSSLTGIKNFPRLKYLDCTYSNLSELDLSGMSNMQYVYVYQSNLKTINLSGCSMLNLLNCRFNCLTSINLAGCFNLGCIMSSNNQLTELDVSDCILLHELSIYENHIASIDVSKNKNLAFLTFEPQEVTAQKVQATGKWTVDLGMLVGKENLNKISSVNVGKFDTATGVLTFDTNPSDFNYTYKASDKFGINVHVTLYHGGLPVITANNLSIDPRDDAFDPLKESGLNLKAIDTEDGDLTASVKAQVKTIAVYGSAAHNATVSYYTIPAVDTKTTELYIIAYTVTDSSGNTANLNVYVTVRIYSSYSSARSEQGSSSNTSIGPSSGIIEMNPTNTSALSAASGMSPPPLGVQDSCVTAVLILTLVTAGAILLFANKKTKTHKRKGEPMKKFIAVLTCLILFSAILPLSLSAAGVPIDEANFPDPVFREYARQIDTDKNGTLSDTERLAVTSILLEKKNNQMVTSIVGIKNFSNLECLSSKESNLIEADLSGMVKLRSFSCNEGNLQSLNLSGCTALDFVSCQFSRLTQIDLTGCSALVDLLCHHNRLTKLDVSDCVQLDQISIYENQIAAIDVMQNKKLIYFTVVPQEVTAQKAHKNGKWTVDLGALVGKENLGKIATYSMGKLDAATGLMTFDTEPTDFNYTYKASEAYSMDVHVTLYRGVLPVITANNITINPRDAAFDPLKEPGLNLNATDAEDGNLTANVKVQIKNAAVWGSASSNATVYNTIPAVDTKKPGLYIITYTVKNSSGNTAALDVYVTVRADDSAGPGPFSILTHVSNTSTGSITSSNGINADNKNDTSALSALSAASGIATPPMGVQDSGTTILLAAILVSAAVLILINKRRQKAD